MTNYMILSHPTERLGIELCAHAVDAVIKTLQYKGSCLYLPVPNIAGKVLLILDRRDADESETEWFLRTLAGYLQAELYETDGSRMFEGSDDNSIDGIDIVPPPEDECLPIRLFFTIDNINIEGSIHSALLTFFIDNGYEPTIESDGFSIFLSSNSYLDIFYRSGEQLITAEIDCTFSGAGVYAEVVELAQALASYLGTEVTFVEDPSITYTTDRDFDKLRRAFYAPIRQQLAFAINDDRDGLQAYIGWGTDAFEPQPMRGTVVTPYGRYELERLLREIETYGFSYVCDRRFLSRNTPSDSSEFYVKEVMNAIWSTQFLNPETELTDEGKVGIDACLDDLETALNLDPYAPFPSDIYTRLCALVGRVPLDCSKTRDYVLHFEPGYMQNEVSYGFGHYLRRFKLPGYIQQYCRAESRDQVYFFKSLSRGLRIEAEVSYGYDGDGTESMLGFNFATGTDIETFDIGGTSVVRYVDGGLVGTRYRAEAEIYIRDEVYRFAMSSDKHADVEWFRDVIRDCISVEDWYDEYIREELPDPHAPGATFCINLKTPKCKAFTSRFPTGATFLTVDEIQFVGPDALPSDSLQKSAALIKRLTDAFNSLYFTDDTNDDGIDDSTDSGDDTE